MNPGHHVCKACALPMNYILSDKQIFFSVAFPIIPLFFSFMLIQANKKAKLIKKLN